MPNLPAVTERRHVEAERLIEIARGLLDRAEDEIIITYLDHAIETLHMVAQDPRPSSA